MLVDLKRPQGFFLANPLPVAGGGVSVRRRRDADGLPAGGQWMQMCSAADDVAYDAPPCVSCMRYACLPTAHPCTYASSTALVCPSGGQTNCLGPSCNGRIPRTWPAETKAVQPHMYHDALCCRAEGIFFSGL